MRGIEIFFSWIECYATPPAERVEKLKNKLILKIGTTLCSLNKH